MNMTELNFAYKVRHALNENLEHLPPATLKRLESARATALSVQKKPSQIHGLFANYAFTGHVGDFVRGPVNWFTRMKLVAPLVIVAAALIGIYQVEEQERIKETAEIDALVLADELPLDAYLDNGFNAYLAERGE